MVLEATMICIDNSESMRNGDYYPSRFLAQADAFSLISGAKTQSNPENCVGMLMMAGKSVRVSLTPTSDLGKLLGCLHGQQNNISGEVNLTTSIHVASLALKHRQNKNQHQRIIVFAGSHVNSDQKDLVKLGKSLKKNSVAIDIINFGEVDEEKEAKLTALVNAVDNNNNSHIVNIPPGTNLSDALYSTPILMDGEDGGGAGFAAAAGGGGAGGAGYEFGVDPNMDPELALALRVSMEEERARQEASNSRAEAEASSNNMNVSQDNVNVSQDVEMSAPDEDEETFLLQQALAMSMEEDTDVAVNDQSSEKEDEYMAAILASLPGVDPNDPSVRELLASMKEQFDDQKEKK